MTNQKLQIPATRNPDGSPDPDPQTIAGLAPSTLVLIVAFTCFLGLVWGVIDGNWVLVATEAPSVLALIGVWAFARAHRSRRRIAMIGSAIGALCMAELWIATAVFEARGMTLAVIVAASTGLTVALGGIWLIWSSHKADRVRLDLKST